VSGHVQSSAVAVAALSAVLIVSAAASLPLQAQAPVERAGGAVPSGPAPRLPNGLPDLSGVWQVPYVPDMTRDGRNQKGHAELPFTAAGRADWESYDAANGDYTGSCLPFGLMRAVNAPYPIQIMQSDKYIALLFEVNTWFHVIPIDGRSHPTDPHPTWFGSSVGRWRDDTLVVETVGFNGYTRLDTVGHPHSDALHMTQTFRRADAGHIQYTVTIEDPKTYTKPWTNERTFTLMPGDLIEYSCEENNKSLWEGRIKRWSPPSPR
jgi:hypothetical protein